MKQPLQGNLALNFLFKDQDFSDIIKMKVDNQTSIRENTRVSTMSTLRDSVLTTEEETKLDVTKIQGYYKRKHSHEINTTADFINKLRKTGVLQKFFS